MKGTRTVNANLHEKQTNLGGKTCSCSSSNLRFVILRLLILSFFLILNFSPGMVNGRTTRSNSLSSESANPATIKDIQVLTKDLKNDILTSIKQEFTALGDRLQILESRIGNLEGSIDSFRTIQKEQQTEINEIKLSLSEIRLSKPDILDEVEDRERRRNNVVLFGVPEHDSGTVSERKVYDEALVQEVFEALGCDEVELDALYRLGRIVSGKSRPIKVTLSTRKAKADIMRKSRALRDSSKFKRVFISNDKTKFQQLEWSELKKELLWRKESGEDVIIYKGKIVQRDSIRNFRM